MVFKTSPCDDIDVDDGDSYIAPPLGRIDHETKRVHKRFHDKVHDRKALRLLHFPLLDMAL